MEEEGLVSLDELRRQERLTINLHGEEIRLKLGQKPFLSLSMNASVYKGTNYIPPSVRQALQKNAPFESPLPTSFVISEEQFEVVLQSEVPLNPAESLNPALEEFALLSSEWREWLDQHDRNDLVHISLGR